MSLLVVGSVAYDAVKTPFGEREKTFGGSAAYFSASASFFTDVNMNAVVGEDYDNDEIEYFNDCGVDTTGLHRVKGNTFFWKGEYGQNLNEAVTIDTQLNVFKDFTPEIPDEYKDSDFVFLANINPELQSSVLKQLNKPRVVALDTMNFWITGKRSALLDVLKKVDILFINSGEVKQLTGINNYPSAAKEIMKMGPRAVIIKHGEYGAVLYNGLTCAFVPAYPIEQVIDPTGAGDSFAGGFMGYLANYNDLSEQRLKQALLSGTVLASFCVQDFSYDNFKRIDIEDIVFRYNELLNYLQFDKTN